MAFATRNQYVTGLKPVPTPSGCEVVACRFPNFMAASDLTANNIGNIAILPAGCVPVGVIVDSDDLDTGNAVVFSIGVSNAAVSNNIQGQTPTDISTAAVDGAAAWATSVTVAQAGGQAQYYSKAMSRVQPVEYNRYIVAKVTTAATTGAAGELGVTLLYRHS